MIKQATINNYTAMLNNAYGRERLQAADDFIKTINGMVNDGFTPRTIGLTSKEYNNTTYSYLIDTNGRYIV